MLNLDLLCAQTGESLKNTDEKMLRDLLSVLEENGVYAMFLYGLSLTEKGNDGNRKQTAKNIVLGIQGLLKKDELGLGLAGNIINDDPVNPQADVIALSDTLTPILKDLDKLFLSKEILEKALVYGIYNTSAA